MEALFIWLTQGLIKPSFWFQPVFYALHGWLATEMAIWMLFHPYEAKYLPGTQIRLPLTPGIFPRGRVNLSHSISETVTRILLTEADLQRQAEALVTEENLVRCIEALMNSAERELKNPDQLRPIYRYTEEVVPDLLARLVNALIDHLETGQTGRKPDAWNRILDEVLASTLSRTRLDYPQAEFIASAIFDTLLTPAYMRRILMEGLTDANIAHIEKTLAEQVGGVKGFLLRFAGLDQSLVRLREYLGNDPAAVEQRILEMYDHLEIREKLAERISRFSFDELPAETRDMVLVHTRGVLTETLSDYREELNALVASAGGRASRIITGHLLQMDLKAWLNEKRPDLKLEIARFLRRYLQRELALMVSRLLPVLDIGKMIAAKLDQFTNEELEHMITGICRRELRWMALLGAFLGFWLGLMSNVIIIIMK